MSGLCQPAYVLDLPGGHGKVPVATAGPCSLHRDSHETGARAYVATDFRRRRHIYRDHADRMAPDADATSDPVDKNQKS